MATEKLESAQETIDRLVRTVPDHPKPGIQFKDITPLCANGPGFSRIIDALVEHYEHQDVTSFAGLESRGFIFAAPLAARLNKGFIVIRKPGKLPGKVHRYEYKKEYGSDILEVAEGLIQKGDRVVVIDDLIATGGSALASIKLIETCGGVVTEACFVIGLRDLNGAEVIAPVKTHCLAWY